MCSKEYYLRKKVMNGETNSATGGRDKTTTRDLKMGASQERRKAREKEQNVTYCG